MSVKKVKVNNLTTFETPINMGDSDMGDLNISDESGNVLVRFENGNIQTKNFNSSNSTNVFKDSSDADLNISDENGNVIIRSKNGHIKTKFFNSEDYIIGINADYLLIPVYGQSLAIGGDTTKFTTSFIYPYKSGN